jgi:outer membrane protein OmpA-like peptidoglycan-associated protein
MRLTPQARKIRNILLVLIGAGVALGARHAYLNGWIPGTKPGEASVPKAVNLAKEGKSSADPSIPAAPLPGSDPVRMSGPAINFHVWAWNAQMGLMLANGGPATTRGSSMEKYGINLNLARQDDTEVMKTELLAFAKALKAGNSNPTDGANFIAIMGDGAAQFFAALNPELEKLGENNAYIAEIVGACGYSRGEDKFMVPREWKENPQAARGGIVAGVLRDGDWNIAMHWCSLNGILNNPDPKTWREDALNWVGANDYLDAATKYIQGYHETRDIVDSQGRRTGKTKDVTVQACVTWTPGDVNAAHERGGLVAALSTRENRMQMPCVIIGIHKWDRANSDKVEGMLAAICEAGDQIKAYDTALRRAAEVSAQVYKEQNADYWYVYYKGKREPDRQGLEIDLGGSTVNNLADNLYLFGVDSNENPLKITYETFGDIVVQQYKDQVPAYPKYESVVDARYLFGVKQRGVQTSSPDVATFKSSENITEKVGNRSWHIEFETGKANFTPQASAVLKQLASTLSVGSGLIVEIHGHTDNVGSGSEAGRTANQSLSLRRAQAVKDWLMTQGARTFPEERIRVTGHGDSQPIADNRSEAGRAQNRRVQIVVGTSTNAAQN